MAHGLVYLRAQSMVMPVLAITSQVSALLSPLFFFFAASSSSLFALPVLSQERACGRKRERGPRSTPKDRLFYFGNVTNESQNFVNRKVHTHYEPDLAVVDG